MNKRQYAAALYRTAALVGIARRENRAMTKSAQREHDKLEAAMAAYEQQPRNAAQGVLTAIMGA